MCMYVSVCVRVCCLISLGGVKNIKTRKTKTEKKKKTARIMATTNNNNDINNNNKMQ